MDLVGFLGTRSRRLIIAASAAFILALGVVDHWTGPDLSLLILYFIPTFFLTWYVGRKAGFLGAGLSALSCFVSEWMWSSAYSHRWVPFWNLGIRMASFLSVAYIVSELKTASERERELARRDPLTGAVNRNFFCQLLEMELKRVRRTRKTFSLAYLDVDGFKTVNDRFGHSAGDALLRLLAQTVGKGIWEVDAIGRLGGDEFAVLLVDADAEEASAVLRRVLGLLLEAVQQSERPVTFSVGLVTCAGAQLTAEEILKVADGLMYSAKRCGGSLIKQDTLGKSLKSGVAPEPVSAVS